MRPYWKGYLKLALVSCPIALHAACSTQSASAFRQINKATGTRLSQQLIDEETREPVDPDPHHFLDEHIAAANAWPPMCTAGGGTGRAGPFERYRAVPLSQC